MAAQQPACPVCGQADMVRKVSTIHYSGIADSALTGSAAGGAVTPGGQAALTQLLAPPPQPTAQRSRAGWDIALWISILAAIVSCMAIPGVMMLAILSGAVVMQAWGYRSSRKLDPYNAVFYASAAILFLSIVATPFILVIRNREEHRVSRINATRKAEWQQAVRRWNDLYYCARDHNVFDPVREQCAPAEQLMAFLYRGFEPAEAPGSPGQSTIVV